MPTGGPHNASPGKQRYPRAMGIAVARELCGLLAGSCERLVVAGSLRRMKAEVGDVEIIYLSKRERRQVDLLESRDFDLAEEVIAGLLASGVLLKRVGEEGHTGWGLKNKLAVHAATGMPVDLFAASEENWWNYLVCRTGPKESNEAIARAAQAKGWKWTPYKQGFIHEPSGEVRAMASEEEVFAFAGLPWKEPKDR